MTIYEALTQKKEDLDRYRPLPPAIVANLNNWFRVELTYTSNAIEGNTLTRQETAMVVEKGLTIGGKSLSEHLEATNHVRALDWVQTQLTRHPNSLSSQDILYLHEMVLRGIHDEHAGRYRHVPVRISGSTVVLPNPRKVPELMAEFVTWLHHSDPLHPVELAAEAHYRLVTIHPFIDGNGRTARLLMNLILLMSGYPPAIIHTADRIHYLNTLEEAQLGGSKTEYLLFIARFIARSVDHSLDIYLDAITNSIGDNETVRD
jgi:Fic family protein